MLIGIYKQALEQVYEELEIVKDTLSQMYGFEIINNIKEEENGINIYIGSENDFDDDVTVIKTKYTINGEEGTIALIGPKRMEYERVITLLNYIMDNISDK